MLGAIDLRTDNVRSRLGWLLMAVLLGLCAHYFNSLRWLVTDISGHRAGLDGLQIEMQRGWRQQQARAGAVIVLEKIDLFKSDRILGDMTATLDTSAPSYLELMRSSGAEPLRVSVGGIPGYAVTKESAQAVLGISLNRMYLIIVPTHKLLLSTSDLSLLSEVKELSREY